jgi:peptidyl-prolyl cis-trans isomerase D
MLQFFRSFMKSKLGVLVTLAFLGLIALAFASADVAGNGSFGGIAGGDRVALVGDRRISTSELSTAVTNAFDQSRQNNPTLSMPAFLAEGGIGKTLDQLIARTALAEFAREHGLRAGKRLVDSELAALPIFQGPDGRFNRTAFQTVLNQRQLTEAQVREDFATNLYAKQLLTPVALAPTIPLSIATRYATLLREHRKGAIALLPSELFAPAGDPTPAQLQEFYRQNHNRFMRPERRVIRYAAFGDEALAALPAPSEAQIAARYQRDQAQYAAAENRTFTQLVVPTEAAANAVLAEVKGGKSLAAAAQEKGLRTVTVGPVNRQAFTTSASAAVATAGFTAAQGALVPPTRGGLGWYLLHVDKVEKKSARSIDQVRGEIAAALATEQRARALADLTARIDDEFEQGKSLAEVARDLKLGVLSTAPVTADGRVYGKPAETVPPVLGRVLKTAFDMDEGQPQLAEVEPGKRYVIFEVPEITASAVAPLAEVRPDAVAFWKRSTGAQAARAAADQIMARMARGASLTDALHAVKPNAPAAQTLDLGREELARQGRVPQQMALFFSMAKGTTKKLAMAGEGGWFVIRLDDVQAGAVAPNDPLIAGTMQQLAGVTGEEYVDQFAKAAQDEVGVQRNPASIRALEAQLSGRASN